MSSWFKGWGGLVLDKISWKAILTNSKGMVKAGEMLFRPREARQRVLDRLADGNESQIALS